MGIRWDRYPGTAQTKSLSHANRGMQLEELIENTNEQYYSNGIAMIQKIPTPTIPRRENGKIVGMVYSEKSTVDFVGCFGSRPIAFDTKNSNDKRIRFDMLKEHQLDFLVDWNDYGIAFVLVGFWTGLPQQRYYVIPIDWWMKKQLAYKQKKDKASVRIDELNSEWKITNGALLQGHGKVALDYLVTVEKLLT